LYLVVLAKSWLQNQIGRGGQEKYQLYLSVSFHFYWRENEKERDKEKEKEH